jgi:acetyl-CoA acetyltransferase
MNDAYIITALRTPVGRYGGALKGVRPDDLAALVVGAAVERGGANPAEIEDVYLGCTNQAGEENRNVARMAALLAGLPLEVAGVTVNRLCGSGLEAVNQAARAAMIGEGHLFVAGGVESMTRAPFVFGKTESAFSRMPPQVYDTTIGWRFTNPRMAALGHTLSMGETAEVVAERCDISREAQDRFALESQRRAHPDHACPRAAPARRALWPGHDVHRRRAGHCHDRRAHRVGRSSAIIPPRQTAAARNL